MDAESELGRALHEEHFWTVVFISGLEARVEGEQASVPMDPEKPADREELERLIGLLDDLGRHESFEEEHVFPLMRRHGGGDLATSLTREHRARRPLADRLRRACLELLRHGGSGPRWSAFRRAVLVFATFILRHIQQEETAVVQKLGTLVDRQSDHELACEYRAEGAARRLRLSAARAPSAFTPAPAPGQMAS